MARDTRTMRSQMGPFGIVPLWVLERVLAVARHQKLDANAVARAVHVYAVLAAKFSNKEHRAWPKREQLADVLGMSMPSLERALRLLRDARALETERRHRADGAVLGLDYLLIQIEPADEAVKAEHLPISPDAKETTDQPLQPEAKAAPDLPISPDGKADDLSISGDGAFPSHQMGVVKEEPDPLNQIQGEREAAEPPPPSPVAAQPEPERRPDPPATFADPLEAFRLAWNDLTSDPIRRCHTLTKNRRRLIRACLVERPLMAWRDVFARLERSSFCRGDNPRGWAASLDWLIASPDPAVKTLEGQYDDHAKTERPFTARELEDARRVRANAVGCPHETRCANAQTCEATIIRKWRRDRGEAA